MRTSLGYRRAALVAGLCAAQLVASRAANADDEDDLAALLSENVVSGASRTNELASDAPATTTTITAEDMRRYGIRSIDEAINFLGMGLITQNPLHSVEVGGRGVLLSGDFGNHVLLVVDGHVLNEPWGGTAYFEQGAAIPMELIDHIELVLGPGAVLYGGNAMFGVVNVVTKRPASYKGAHIIGEVSASPQQGRGGSFTSFAPSDLGTSYRIATGIGHELQVLGKPFQISVQAELYRQNGPSFEFGPQAGTTSEGAPRSFGDRSLAPGVWGGRTHEQYTTTLPTLYGRAVWGDFAISARLASYQRRTPYVNGFNQVVSDFDEPRSLEHDRWASLDVQYRKHLTTKLSVMARAYADVYDYHQVMFDSQGENCASPVLGRCLTNVLGRSRWVGVELQATYDWRGDERLTTLFGVDGRLRDIGGKNSSYDADTGAFGGNVGEKYLTELAGAAYVQQRWSPVDVLHLNAGARFDMDPRGGNRLAPRAAAAIDAWRGGVLKVVYAEAFRAPTFYEAFYEGPGQRSPVGLRSETVRSLEATVEQKVGRHRFLMGAFRTWWRDMIYLETLEDGSLQYVNAASIDNFGYNARAQGAFGNLHYGLSVTGAYSRRNTPDGTEALPVAPQLFGNARLAYDFPGALPTVALATSLVGKRPADRAFDGGFAVTPVASAQVDLRLTLSDRFPGIPELSYRLSANYVTSSRSPYVVGPTQTGEADASGARPSAELAPINRLNTFLTLQYDLSL